MERMKCFICGITIELIPMSEKTNICEECLENKNLITATNIYLCECIIELVKSIKKVK